MGARIMRLLRWCFALGVAGIHVIDIEFDGDHLALPFLHGDDLHARARAFVADYPGLVGGGCVLGDAECLVAMLVSTMRSRIGDAPTPSGELAGCPALTPEARDAVLESDAPRGVELDALVERAHALAGPARRLVVTIVTGGYVDFAISWSEGLRRARVEFLVVAQDDTALASLGPRLGRSVIAASSSRNAPGGAGELEAASYGSPEFHAATRRKPEVVRALSLSGLDVLFADADVAFVRDPWPSIIQRQAWPSSGEQTCGVQAQPNHLDEDVAWNLIEFDESARNPTPGRRYFGRSLCSGLVYFAANSTTTHRLLAFWQRALRSNECGGDQAALEAAAGALAKVAPQSLEQGLCALPLQAFPNGMAFKAFGMEQHIASRRSLPPLLAAVHFNYVVGNDEKRRWAKSAGLWFSDEDSLQLPTESTLSIHHDGLNTADTEGGGAFSLEPIAGATACRTTYYSRVLAKLRTHPRRVATSTARRDATFVTSDTSMAAWPNVGAPARNAEFWTSGDYHRCYPWPHNGMFQDFDNSTARAEAAARVLSRSVPPALLNDTTGPPIVVFNLGCPTCKLASPGEDTPIDCEHVLIHHPRVLQLMSSAHARHFRRGVDVAWPLPLSPAFISESEAALTWRRRAVRDQGCSGEHSARPFLLSFVGRESHPVREDMSHLDNAGDVLVHVSSRRHQHAANAREVDEALARRAERSGCDLFVAKPALVEQTSQAVRLMACSRFVVAPRGHALHSSRLLEALAVGAVPVVVSDGWVLPFEHDGLDWTRLALRVPQSRAANLTSAVREVTPERWCELAAAGRRAWSEWLEGVEQPVEALLRVLASRRAGPSPRVL